MTAPRTRAHRAPPAEPKTPVLSPTQIAAGAAASVTTTVVASFLGVAGTLIGAGLGSVVSTVAAAAYAQSLEKGTKKLTRVRPGGREVPAETQLMPALPPVNGSPGIPAKLSPRRAPHFTRKRWMMIGGYAAGMFVVVMGVITGVELIGQKPVSAMVTGHETSKSTTFTAVTDTSSSSTKQDQAPASPSAPTTAPSTEESAPTTAEESSTTATEPSASSTSRTTASSSSSSSKAEATPSATTGPSSASASRRTASSAPSETDVSQESTPGP